MTTVLILDDRERDTIIAALRYWQHHLTKTAPDMAGLMEIADNDRNGGDAALLPEEIDNLIERRVNSAIEDRCDAISTAREVLCSDWPEDSILSELDDKLYYGLAEAAEEDRQLEKYDLGEDEDAEDEDDDQNSAEVTGQ